MNRLPACVIWTSNRCPAQTPTRAGKGMAAPQAGGAAEGEVAIITQTISVVVVVVEAADVA